MPKHTRHSIDVSSSQLFAPYYCECLSNVSTQPWAIVAIASGTNANVSGDANHPGVWSFIDSTTTNSGARLQTSAFSILLAGSETTEFVFKVPVTTNTTVRLGFHDATTSTAPTDGAWIDIAGTTLSGKTNDNTSPSTTGTTYTITADTWYKGTIAVNSDATLVTFTLYAENGTQLWTDTLATTIPTGAGRVLAHGAIATNSGTTGSESILQLDFMNLLIKRSLVR